MTNRVKCLNSYNRHTHKHTGIAIIYFFYFIIYIEHGHKYTHIHTGTYLHVGKDTRTHTHTCTRICTHRHYRTTELQKRRPPGRKKQIEEAICKIDKELLNSYKEESVVNETRAIENIKSNPKYFFSYARKKLKTRNKIGPFDIEGEKFTSLSDICIKLVQQYSSSFSQPDPRYKIENPKEFFTMNS